MNRYSGAIFAASLVLMLGSFATAEGPYTGIPPYLSDFDGTFKDDRLSITLWHPDRNTPETYVGKAVLGGKTFGIKASGREDTLTGQFIDEAGNAFDFSARRDGDKVTVQSGRTTYALAMEKPKSGNPFDNPAPAAGNPFDEKPAPTAKSPENPFLNAPAPRTYGPGSNPDPARDPVRDPGPAPAGGQPGGVGMMVMRGDDGNVRVMALKPDGPAMRAGVREGDVLLEVDGKSVAALKDPTVLVRGDAGTEVKLTLERGGKRTEVPMMREAMVLPPNQPAVDGPRGEAPRPDPRVDPRGGDAPRKAGVGININIGGDGGIMISDVVPNGPAARAGLQRGDRLIGIDGKPIQGVEDLSARLPGEAGSAIRLTVVRGGRTGNFDLKREVTAPLGK